MQHCHDYIERTTARRYALIGQNMLGAFYRILIAQRILKLARAALARRIEECVRAIRCPRKENRTT